MQKSEARVAKMGLEHPANETSPAAISQVKPSPKGISPSTPANLLKFFGLEAGSAKSSGPLN